MFNKHKNSGTTTGRLRSTVGRKVALGLTLTILIGVAALVYFESNEQRKNLTKVSVVIGQTRASDDWVLTVTT